MSKHSKSRKKKSFSTSRFILNCTPSVKPEDDWTFEDAITAGVVELAAAAPARKDLRRDWWKVEHQGSTGACVGYAAAYGVLRWHYVKAGRLPKTKKPSARFIWIANKCYGRA